MNPIIKQIKKGLKIAAASLLVAVTVATTVSCTNNTTLDYSTNEEITQIAEMIDCDTSYLRVENGCYYRMQHNGDEPIYVHIDSSYNEEERQTAIKSLDKMFGIVNKINDKYNYKIVDKAEFNSKIGKTKIYFNIDENVFFDSDKAKGEIKYYYSPTNLFSSTKLINYHEIVFDRDMIEKDNERDLEFTFDHELLHAFGAVDIYEIKDGRVVFKSLKGNTIMNSNFYGKVVDVIPPNDVKCLISLYSPSVEKAEELKPALAKYTEKYYQKYTEACEYSREQEFNETDFVFTSTHSGTNHNGENYSYIYDIVVEDGKYSFKMIDNSTGKIINTCSGESISINGFTVLRDVSLNETINPKTNYLKFEDGIVQDLFIGYFSGQSLEATPALIDLHTHWLTYGEVDVLEKGIEQ